MKNKFALMLLSSPTLFAGAAPTVLPPASSGDWIKPMIDIRARYEFGDLQGFDASHALTVRERLGLKTKAVNGFSALLEGEFSQAVVDDFNGGALGVDPFELNNTVIGDPQTNELNQAFVQYEGLDSVVKLGRQRIKYDNDAFVGNVGWRQNEQTYDAISILNKSIAGLSFNYAYISQADRIFGSDADGKPGLGGNVQDLASSSHLFNASYVGIPGYTIGGYAYIMNFEDVGAFDNNTIGGSVKTDAFGLTLYGELAYQDKAGLNGEEDAIYVHATAAKAVGIHTFTLGVEHLEAGLKTPLSTLHAFNGFADVFIGGRGNGGHNGLTDVYVSHAMPIFYGIKWINVVHAFGDNELSAGYGWEYNSVLNKKFNDNFSAVGKFAFFTSEGDAFVGKKALPDATRMSVELNYMF